MNINKLLKSIADVVFSPSSVNVVTFSPNGKYMAITSNATIGLFEKGIGWKSNPRYRPEEKDDAA